MRVVIAMFVMLGCGPHARAPEGVEAVEEIEEDAPPAPVATEEIAVEAPEPPAPPSSCAVDGDCHFDDACVPTRCIAGPQLETACEESGPTPGACVCLAERCTLRRPGIAYAPGACGADDATRCGFSASDGSCVPGHADERPLDLPPSAARPVCVCGPHEGEDRCSTEWDEPVACTSERDCWWGEVNGRHRWIRRPRGVRFRPCVDGSSPPMCIDGFCGTDPLFAFGC